ncbi:MAG: type II toxin-antitoxin system PemK/MazF family toxin [Bifidobacteriaceae bacterium]|nr:type II toxin-antitoxin system PemK/MazF family toxin [Bifidobacteriaceae bacterium]
MRGDIYKLRGARNPEGHEQRGQRYGVVVLSDYLPLATVLVAPTSTKALPTDFRPQIEINGVATLVLVEQTAALDAQMRLGDFAGRLAASELADLDRALMIVFGLR